MTQDFKATRYTAHAYWYRRDDPASVLARRYGRYMDSIRVLDPILHDWIVGLADDRPYEDARHDLTSMIRQDTTRDELGHLAPDEGYALAGRTEHERQSFVIYGSVGRSFPSPDMNHLTFSTDFGIWPDLSLMSYKLYRSVVLTTIACWEPIYCTARPTSLCLLTPPGSWFFESWMTYVHPSLVHRVALPDIPVVESTPDGGLLFAATTETFRAENPDHLEAARRIAGATRGLNDVMPPI